MNQSALIEQPLAKIKALEERLLVLENVEKENVKLRKENAILREKLSKYENPKNSRNSSIPPSKDENRPLKTKSLRESSNKKVGGQQGHEGNTLKMTDSPDKIIKYVPDFCCACGSDLQDASVEFVSKRQVVDIPIIKPEYIEHRIFKKQCGCGHSNCAAFPENVKASISYGANAESLVGYLYSRQYMPFDRMREFFNDAFHLPISEGGLHELLNRLVAKSAPAYQIIKDKITQSTVVGADETGTKINGKKSWFWTWQNDTATFIAPSDNRGFATIQTNFENGFENAVLLHDCWKSHFQTPAISHQICTAHLLRELNYFIETTNAPWASKCRQLIRDALKVKQDMKPQNYYTIHQPKLDILDRYDKLLEESVDEKIKDLLAFKKRLVKYKDYLFNFLNYPDVPPDNNGSERAIRNVKVKQKISGQFKSMNGAMNFATLRSITDTAIKNGQNVLNALLTIATITFEPVITD